MTSHYLPLISRTKENNKTRVLAGAILHRIGMKSLSTDKCPKGTGDRSLRARKGEGRIDKQTMGIEEWAKSLFTL